MLQPKMGEHWFIKGTRGELYPCKPDVFADCYEGVATAHLYENAEEVREHGHKCTASGAALLALSGAFRSVERAARGQLLDVLKRRARDMAE